MDDVAVGLLSLPWWVWVMAGMALAAVVLWDEDE